MPNIFDRTLKQELEPRKVLHQSDILPGQIKQRNMEPGLYGIKFGLAADRPTTPGTDGSFFAYFATDTYVLSCWSDAGWKDSTLT